MFCTVCLFSFFFAYFSGTKDDKGTSWCPDCVTAEPNVRGKMSHLPDGSVFSLFDLFQIIERPYYYFLFDIFLIISLFSLSCI
uniref:Thioredoxin domain-containing protein 17 n=1 Tax=Oryzias latipes TaxID=8090 RepID=A0A3P9JBU0_ORYLA